VVVAVAVPVVAVEMALVGVDNKIGEVHMSVALPLQG
jgi:hypothetical protein